MEYFHDSNFNNLSNSIPCIAQYLYIMLQDRNYITQNDKLNCRMLPQFHLTVVFAKSDVIAVSVFTYFFFVHCQFLICFLFLLIHFVMIVLTLNVSKQETKKRIISYKVKSLRGLFTAELRLLLEVCHKSSAEHHHVSKSHHFVINLLVSCLMVEIDRQSDRRKRLS